MMKHKNGRLYGFDVFMVKNRDSIKATRRRKVTRTHFVPEIVSSVPFLSKRQHEKYFSLSLDEATNCETLLQLHLQ
jgi:hypothetical protein